MCPNPAHPAFSPLWLQSLLLLEWGPPSVVFSSCSELSGFPCSWTGCGSSWVNDVSSGSLAASTGVVHRWVGWRGAAHHAPNGARSRELATPVSDAYIACAMLGETAQASAWVSGSSWKCRCRCSLLSPSQRGRPGSDTRQLQAGFRIPHGLILIDGAALHPRS